MALEIFKLVGSIFVDSKAAEESLQKTDSKAEKVGKTLLGGVGKAAAFGGAVVAGAAAAVTGLAAVAEKTSAACDVIDKQSQKLSMSRQTYQELDYICGLYGTDVDKLGTAMKTMTTSIAGNSDAFAALGISTTDANGQLRSTEDVFLESIDALKGVQNETERNALANQLFGKSYQDLLPLLNDSSTSVEELRQKANDLGIVMSDDMVKSGASLQDTLATMKAQFSAVGMQLGGALMPILQKVCEYIISLMPQIIGLAQKLEPIITQLFSDLLPPLMDLAEQLIPVIINLMTTLIPPITQIVMALVPVLVRLIQMILPPLVEIISAVLPILVQLLEPIIELLGPILDILEPILGFIMNLIRPLLDLQAKALKPLVEFIRGPLKEALKGVASFVQPVIDVFVKLGNGIKNAFASIKNAIKLPHFSVKPSGWKIADLLKGSIPHLGVDWYAQGGIMNKPTAFGVNGDNIMAGGEAGPEAIAPISTLKKYIAEAVDSSNAQLAAAVLDIRQILQATLPDIADSKLVLDTGELVGATVKQMDAALGALALKRERGV